MRHLLVLVLLWFALGQLHCTSAQTTCKEDSDCPKGRYCTKLVGACSQECSVKLKCPTGRVCDLERGRCDLQASQCTTHNEQRCVGTDLYWFNSCGEQEEIARQCGAAGCVNGTCQTEAASCGDGTCDSTGRGESCSTCPTDCGCQAPNTCQNGSCQPPISSCGDGSCDATKNENCASCIQDCACPSGLTCQNDTCQTPPLACGNGTCEPPKGENCGTCAKDCTCPAGQTCQNGFCQAPPKDCGNGTCEAARGETCESCPKDCTCPADRTCLNGACQNPTQWPPAPPTIHPQDPHRLAIAGKTWTPVGYYPGAGMNMTGNDYKGDVYLYWKTFVDKLAAAKLNHMRLWLNWGTVPSTGDDSWDRYVMTPYVRNTGGKVDLSKFNPDYFALLKTFVDYTRAKGIILQMMILDCWHVSVYSADRGVIARDFFKKANNVNGVDFAGLADWTDTKGKVFPHLKRFVQEVVKTVGDRPNIIWETCNELILKRGDNHYTSWQNTKTQPFHTAIATVIRNQEKASGFKPHLIMPIDLPEHRTVGGHSDVTATANTQAHQALVSQYAWKAVLLSDNDCFCQSGTAALRRQRGWAALTAGAHINFFDNEGYKKSVLTGTTLDNALKFLGHINTFLQQSGIELAGMRPSDNLVSNGAWALAAAGNRFIVYLPKGGSTTVQQLPAQRNAQWFNPRNGTFTASAGNGPTFQAPNTQDWVLLIQAGTATNTCGNGTCEAAKGENCASCAKDCACPAGQTCQNGACQAPNPCGNGSCEAARGENCSSCAADCACPAGQACTNNTCKASQCLTGTVPNFTITTQAPSNSRKLPMKDDVTYRTFKIDFEFNPGQWQPDCYNPVHNPPRLMSPFQVLIDIRKGQQFCRGGNLFSVNLRGGRNADIWADTYYKPAITSSCGGATEHQLLSNRPKHSLQTGTFYKVSIFYSPPAKDFTLTLNGATHKGTPYPQAILKSTASAPLYLRFSLERWLECFNSSGAKDPNAKCCHLPSIAWQYRNISYEICP